MNRKQIDFWKRKSFFVLLFLTAAGMLLLNCITPLIADDYSYSFIWGTEERLGGLGDIVYSQYQHYLTWGGRTMAHFLGQLFLWLGKPVFNVFNTAAYLLLSLFLYKIVKKEEKQNTILFLMIQFFLWRFSVAFGETSLWLIGSCNYLWGAMFMVGFLIPYHQAFHGTTEKKAKWFWIPWFFLGVVAGWYNENTSGACLMMVLLYLISYRLQKKKLPLFAITGATGNAIGLALVVLAPGNMVRVGTSDQGKSLFEILTERFSECLNMVNGVYFWLILIFLILYAFTVYGKSRTLEEKAEPMFFFLSALACNFVMIAAPEYPFRATFGMMVFLIAAVLLCYESIKKDLDQRIILAAVSCMIFYLLVQYGYAAMDNAYLYRDSRARTTYILEEKEKGNKEIILTDELKGETKYSPMYRLNDISISYDYWLNTNTCAYFGLDSIVRVE